MGRAPSEQLPCEAGVRAALPRTLPGNARVHRQAGWLAHHGEAGCSLPSPAALRVKQLPLVSPCPLPTPDSTPELLCWDLWRSPQAGGLAQTQQLQSGSLMSSRRKRRGFQEASWPSDVCSCPVSLWGIQGQSHGDSTGSLVRDASALARWAVPLWVDGHTRTSASRDPGPDPSLTTAGSRTPRSEPEGAHGERSWDLLSPSFSSCCVLEEVGPRVASCHPGVPSCSSMRPRAVQHGRGPTPQLGFAGRRF